MIWTYKRTHPDGKTSQGFGVPVWAVVGGVREQVVYQLPAGDQEQCVVDLRSGMKIAPITDEHRRATIPETVAAALSDRLGDVPNDRVRALIDAAQCVNKVASPVGLLGGARV